MFTSAECSLCSGGEKLEALKVITPVTLNGVTSVMKTPQELSLKEPEH